MGKLVPQDENDEPASILLEKIKAEKDKLVKEKKIKKSKALPPITDDEIPYNLPIGWEWVRLDNFGFWGSGATPNCKEPDYYENGTINWFKSGELNDNFINNFQEKITQLAVNECSLRENKIGDVLIAMYGATIGKVAILQSEATTNQAVCACTCLTDIYNLYLFLLLKAWKYRFIIQGAGAAQPNISRQKIIQTVVPLPPLNEQHRIVKKVDQLMKYCDNLEQQLTKRIEDKEKLIETAIYQLLAA